jgi:hypothetical protein
MTAVFAFLQIFRRPALQDVDLSVRVRPPRDDLTGEDDDVIRQRSGRTRLESSGGFPGGESNGGVRNLFPNLTHDSDVELKQ